MKNSAFHAALKFHFHHTLTSAATQPTANSVRADQAVTLQQTGRAVRDVPQIASRRPVVEALRDL